MREREAKAAVRDRSVAIGSPTNQCRRPDVNAPKPVFSGADLDVLDTLETCALGAVPLHTRGRRFDTVCAH